MLASAYNSFVSKSKMLKINQDWGCASLVEQVLGMHDALGTKATAANTSENSVNAKPFTTALHEKYLHRRNSGSYYEKNYYQTQARHNTLETDEEEMGRLESYKRKHCSWLNGWLILAWGLKNYTYSFYFSSTCV